MDLQLADVLIFALYAITAVILASWARRSAHAAAESTIAAKRSADAAERSANAAERSATAAEAQTALNKRTLTAQLGEHQRERLRIQPIFVKGASGGKVGAFQYFDIRNVGARVTSVELLSTEGQLKVELGKHATLDKDSTMRVKVTTPASGWFEVGYIDGDHQQGSVWVYTDGSSKVIPLPAGEPKVPDREMAEWLGHKSA